MKESVDRTNDIGKQSVQQISHESGSTGTAQLKDNRSVTAVQRKLQDSMTASGENDSNSIQRKANNTGLPDNLKSGIENLSGYSMDDVKVHYNSSKPAQLQAHAYAQGSDIHLASGQEKHLPHEAWHVVQQKQGRVKPTRQMKSKVNINDDAGLEREADVMGARATNFSIGNITDSVQLKTLDNSSAGSETAQLNNELYGAAAVGAVVGGLGAMALGATAGPIFGAALFGMSVGAQIVHDMYKAEVNARIGAALGVNGGEFLDIAQNIAADLEVEVDAYLKALEYIANWPKSTLPAGASVFHNTTWNSANSIISDGIRPVPNRWTDGGALGAGFYTAGTFDKATVYGESITLEFATNAACLGSIVPKSDTWGNSNFGPLEKRLASLAFDFLSQEEDHFEFKFQDVAKLTFTQATSVSEEDRVEDRVVYQANAFIEAYEAVFVISDAESVASDED